MQRIRLGGGQAHGIERILTKRALTLRLGLPFVDKHRSISGVHLSVAFSLFIGASFPFADYYAVAPGGSREILTFRDLLSIPVLATILGVPVAAFFLLRKQMRSAAGRALLCCLIVSAVAITSARLGNRIRMNAFEALAERSAPLIDAIKAYNARCGVPPASLNALTPEFIPAIPKTGLGAYPDYKYFVSENGARDGNPWVLVVFTPTGPLNFDEFIYYPLQNYPPYYWDTNPVERVRDWAYLHE